MEPIDLNEIFKEAEVQDPGDSGDNGDNHSSIDVQDTLSGDQHQTDTNASPAASGEISPMPANQNQTGWTMFPIAKIKVGERLQKIDPENVESLVNSIRERGLLINPITVKKGGELISGLHRLEACKHLGMAEVPVIIVDATPSEAKLIEIDENLIRRERTPLEKSELIIARKKIYEKDNPGTKKGGDRRSKEALSKSQNDTLVSFARDTAEKMGASESKVQRLAKIGSKITPKVMDMIRNNRIAKSQNELLMLAELSPIQQQNVAQVLIGGKADSVRDALEYMAQPAGPTKMKGTTPGKKGKPNKVPSNPAAKEGTRNQVSPNTTGEALKGTTAVEPEPPAQTPPLKPKVTPMRMSF